MYRCLSLSGFPTLASTRKETLGVAAPFFSNFFSFFSPFSFLGRPGRPLEETVQQIRGIECDLCDEAIDGIAVSVPYISMQK